MFATRLDSLAVGAVREGGKYGISGRMDSVIWFVAEVPDTDGPVFGGGDESLTVVTQRNRSNLFGMPREGLCADSAEGVPYSYTIVLQVVVFRGGYDVFSVIAEEGRAASQGVEALAFFTPV